jgi:16S rRNA (cytidine1402-2'-O)-methyltransferase
MPGGLTVVPTPIGNMEDLSDRARRALEEADVVACEDTRRTGLLYERLGMRRPRLVSNHEGNEADRARQLAQAIERGARVV